MCVYDLRRGFVQIVHTLPSCATVRGQEQEPTLVSGIRAALVDSSELFGGVYGC